MAVRKTPKGTVSVSHRNPLVADDTVAAAVAEISNMRATKKQCTSKEDAAKVVVLQAVGDRERVIINDEGDVICEVLMVERKSCSVDDFVEALSVLYEDVWAVLMDKDPRAVEAARELATKKESHPRVLPK